MRPVEVLEIARVLLPGRWVQEVSVVTVLTLLATGTFDDVVVWFVMEHAAARLDDLEPILERPAELSRTQPQTP